MCAVQSALADETRLRILNLLRGGPLCVCHVQEALQLPQPKISKQL
ncbi:ArsR family transcriptional regulator, partial [Pelagicoccus mobilis]